MPGIRKSNYNPEPFQKLLRQLLDQTGESYRDAGAAAGLSRTAVVHYMTKGSRPMRDVCIALADHFGINPNKMLVAAGYAPLEIFDRRDLELGKVSPEGKQLLEKFEQITDSKTRILVYKTLDTVLTAYLHAQQSGTGVALTADDLLTLTSQKR